MTKLKDLFFLPLALCLALGLAGCPGDDDDDDSSDDDDTTAMDDDDTTGDDDDTTIGDDDDSWGDDDDIAVECGWSEGNIELWSSEGIDFEGTWYEGQLAFTSEGISVVTYDGQEVSFTMSDTFMLSNVEDGEGRVFFWNGGATAFGTDAILGFEVWGPSWRRGLVSNQAPVPDALQAEWGVVVEPDRFGCEWEIVESKCGAYAPLPLLVEQQDPLTGMAVSYYMMPGSSVSDASASVSFEHIGGVVNFEIVCPDTPEFEYAWVFTQTIDSILGVGATPGR